MIVCYHKFIFCLDRGGFLFPKQESQYNVIYWSTYTCIRFLKKYCREKKIMFYHSACVAIYPTCTIHVNKLYIAYRLRYLLIFKVKLMFTICWESWLHIIITVPVKPHDLYEWAPRGLGAFWPWNHWILEGSNLLF